MTVQRIFTKLMESVPTMVPYLKRRKKRSSGPSGPMMGSSSLEPKVKGIVPQRGIEDFCRFYNREYRKYNSVKHMKKSIMLMSREEFAYRRALMLTLRSLMILDKNEDGGDSILELMRNEDVEEIEMKLRRLK